MIKKYGFSFLLIIGIWLACESQSTAQANLSMAGEWQLRLDPADQGIREHWWDVPYAQTVHLPGSLTENGIGDAVTLQTPWVAGMADSSYFLAEKYAKYRQGDIKIPFWLKPTHYYTGPAWYRRPLSVPADWKGKRILLNLERCHWETMVYVNGRYAGNQNSLVAPHTYDLTGLVKAGQPNTIAIRVDNRIKINVGQDSHSISDNTQTNWNGLVGDLSLTATDPDVITNVQVYPNLAAKAIRVVLTLEQPHRQTFTGRITLIAKPLQGKQTTLPALEQPITLTTDARSFTYTYSIPEPQLWDEFTPNRYELTARLVDDKGTVKSEKVVPFGMREIGTQGTRITLNGRPIFLRGDVDCAAFPLTGYPPTTEAPWEKIMTTLKQYGLNHLRFHSWCPPEAAFAVADRLGIYLYVESPSWANHETGLGTGGLVDTFIYDESERMLAQYGNHPSFCLMSYGNEPGGAQLNAFLGRWVDHFKQKDSRRLYTSGAGWPMLPENQFHIHSDARIQRWGEGLKSIINGQPPQTSYDWRDIIRPATVPYISHEIGQWCVYPNFAEMPKYTGILKPTNFEIFNETLEANGMGNQAGDFLQASGRLQTLCYKADIEAALRTPGFGGFQLLGLHDFPGQGSALVGALDVFYDPKPYTNAREYRTFCNPTVLLARMDKLVYENSEALMAKLEIAHFGPAELKNQTILWQLVDGKGAVKQHGSLTKDRVTFDNAQAIGDIRVPLNGVKSPQQLRLQIALKGTDIANSWDVWVYPAGLNADAAMGEVVIAHDLTDEVMQQLQQGASVLLLPYGHVKEGKGAEVKIGFSSIFWNTLYTKNQPPHTLGLLCNPKHPLFASFPTESYSNYQWQDIVSHAQPVILDGFPTALRPLIQPIDTWFENRRLSLAFEARVGKGKLMVCSIDLETDIAKRPPARQLKYSLLNYMNSNQFKPTQDVSVEQLKSLFQRELTLDASAKK